MLAPPLALIPETAPSNIAGPTPPAAAHPRALENVKDPKTCLFWGLLSMFTILEIKQKILKQKGL